MSETKYEQPKLEAVAFASVDILMTSIEGEKEVSRGGLSTSYSGAKAEIDWGDIWGE